MAARQGATKPYRVRERVRESGFAAATEATETMGEVVPLLTGQGAVDQECYPPVPTDDMDPETGRLREISRLHLKGHTFEEIGRRYGVVGKTVQRWMKEANRRKVNTVRAMTAETVVGEFFYRQRMRDAEMARLQEAAMRRGNIRVAVDCVKEMGQADLRSFMMMEKLGFFNGFDPQSFTSKESREMREMSRAMLNITEGRFDPTDIEAEEEDQEPL